MNYDLCDLLNRKMENIFGVLNDFPTRSTFKNQNIIDSYFENAYPEDYLETISGDDCDHEVFSFWIYRNGKISNQIDDFEKSSRRVMKELSNMTFSNNPVLDIMYFSGIIKISIAKNKAFMVDTCIRPTLDQMFTLRDLELKYLSKNGKILWKIYERKKKLMYYEGVGVNDLHSFKWSRIK